MIIESENLPEGWWMLSLLRQSCSPLKMPPLVFLLPRWIPVITGSAEINHVQLVVILRYLAHKSYFNLTTPELINSDYTDKCNPLGLFWFLSATHKGQAWLWTPWLPYYAISRYATWYENQKTSVRNKTGNVFPEQMQCYNPPGFQGSHVTKQ